MLWVGDSMLVWSQSETAREVNEMIGEIQSRWMMVDWKVPATLRWSKSQGGAGEHAYLFISVPGQPMVLVNFEYNSGRPDRRKCVVREKKEMMIWRSSEIWLGSDEEQQAVAQAPALVVSHSGPVWPNPSPIASSPCQL